MGLLVLAFLFQSGTSAAQDAEPVATIEDVAPEDVKRFLDPTGLDQTVHGFGRLCAICRR